MRTERVEVDSADSCSIGYAMALVQLLDLSILMCCNLLDNGATLSTEVRELLRDVFDRLQNRLGEILTSD